MATSLYLDTTFMNKAGVVSKWREGQRTFVSILYILKFKKWKMTVRPLLSIKHSNMQIHGTSNFNSSWWCKTDIQYVSEKSKKITPLHTVKMLKFCCEWHCSKSFKFLIVYILWTVYMVDMGHTFSFRTDFSLGETIDWLKCTLYNSKFTSKKF